MDYKTLERFFFAYSNKVRARCRRCRRMHFPCMDNGCIPDQQWIKLRKYAEAHGVRWRYYLRKSWAGGHNVLPWARKVIGDRQLSKVCLDARRYGQVPLAYGSWDEYDEQVRGIDLVKREAKKARRRARNKRRWLDEQWTNEHGSVLD